MIHKTTHQDTILACVIKQYGTGLYRACVSMDKGHTLFLSSHPDEDGANETIHQFQEACRGGTIKTAEDVLSFAGSLVVSRGGNGALISRDEDSREEELSLAA